MKDLYRVLIVEKQSQMVHVYKNMLPWEDYGFQIASVTDNEDKAIAYYGEYKYELIFTAIDLKSGNGISLINQLRHLSKHSHIVVISSHEDYDTVREAFKAGCNDYLLKSRIRYSSLATLLEEVKEELDADKAVTHDENWAEKLENLLGLLRDKQKVDTSVILEILANEDFTVLRQPYRMLYFRMDNVRIFNRTMKQYDKPSWMSAEEFIKMFQNKLALRDEMQLKLKEIIERDFTDIPEMRMLFTKKHSGLILIPETGLEDAKERAIRLIQHINEILTYEFSISVSPKAEGMESFLPTYEEIMEYHDHKFYDGDFCMEVVEEQKQYEHLQAAELKFHDRIVNALDVQQYEMSLSQCKEAIAYMRAHQIVPGEVKNYFCSIIDLIEEMVKGKGIAELYPFDVLRQGIQEVESIMYLDLELEKILKTLIDWMKENHVSRYKKQVGAIVAYVHDHIDQKITLDMVAQSIGLSEIHTSRIFKKETGTSVIDYVNEIKMQKAAELLKNESLKIKDVAKQIGMEDQLYFNKVFKKYYQIGPREFRKKL